MAKKSMIARDKKREKCVNKYAQRRAELKEIVRKGSPKEQYEALLALQAMPVDASKTRVRNRCVITGRPRGYYRKFGVCRNKLRELTMDGKIPGIVKASW